MLPWVVRLDSGEMVGTTRYHDIVTEVDRVEIGYTWYAARWQRSHVNTACKLLLLDHAFEALDCGVVGLRTDRFNTRSQRAIEALGANRRRRDPPSHAPPGRHRARHGDVQHPAHRVSGHPPPPALADGAERLASVLPRAVQSRRSANSQAGAPVASQATSTTSARGVTSRASSVPSVPA
jgi:hypothetical protein